MSINLPLVIFLNLLSLFFSQKGFHLFSNNLVFTQKIGMKGFIHYRRDSLNNFFLQTSNRFMNKSRGLSQECQKCNKWLSRHSLTNNECRTLILVLKSRACFLPLTQCYKIEFVPKRQKLKSLFDWELLLVHFDISVSLNFLWIA